MGITIHYADGTVEQSQSEHSEGDDGHDHDTVPVEGTFGDYRQCTKCGLKATADQLEHVACE